MGHVFFRRLASAVVASTALSAAATDWYVGSGAGASDSNDGMNAAQPLASLDKAIVRATANDTIYVAPGVYATTNQWGPNLKAMLIGTGSTREEVVIQSAGTYRTLRMAAGSWLENVTVVGEGTFKADKGGAIEMSGGTVTNCIVRGGTAKSSSSNTEGGNLYVSGSSLVVDSAIYGGHATKRGGNIYLDAGTVRGCTIYGGVSDNVGGNVYQYGGVLSRCVITGGAAVNDGGNVRMNGGCVLEDSSISCGTNTATSGDKKGANVFMDSSSKLSRCRLSGGANAAGYNGGSLCVNSSSALVEDSLVEASECGGVLLGGTSSLYNCTVVNNEPYGVWAWSGTQHIFNTVIFGNTKEGVVAEWNGNLPTSSSGDFVNCALSSDNGRFSQSAFPTLVLIDASAFADYMNSDYSPSFVGALVDAGASDPRGASASAVDFIGAPRVSGTVDIGCYEYQRPDMTVRIDSAVYDQVFAPATVTFAHASENAAAPANVTFTYDFGDGSAPATTGASTISHAYAQPGVYSVRISALDVGGGESAEMVYAGYVRVASSTVYVTPDNSSGAAFPYNTPETGYGDLKAAVQSALDGYTLLLAPGVYETADQISFGRAITIRGLGAKPEDVIVRNTSASPNQYYHRTLEVNNAGALVANLAIENGCVKNQNGGNLRLVAGVVSNCVIRGGLAVVDGETANAAGGGVELAGAGVLTHCVVSNNVVQGTSSNQGLAGGAVFVANGAKRGRVSNCLIVCNSYVTSGDEPRDGASGIRFGGSNDDTQIENNTIACNKVEGSLRDDSAGVHCTTWYGRLRNNIVVGNYETGKDGFSSVKMDTAHGTYANNLTDGEASAERLFKDFLRGDFRLRPGCAANDKGTSGVNFLPSADLAGKPRVHGRAIDIGCYECQVGAGTLFIVQ